MSTRHRSPVFPPARHRTLRGIRLWLAVIAALPATFAGWGQNQGVPKESVADGLTAKFVDVPALAGVIKTRYYEAGQGEPLVLVHGGGFSGYYSANVWSRNIPGLARRFHVFAPDKLASGMTDNPPRDQDYAIEGEVEHIYRFIQTMKLGKVHLVGQSRGGALVWLLAINHPELVRTLVIVDSNTASPAKNPNIHDELLAKCPQDRDEGWKCEMRTLSYQPTASQTFPEAYFASGIYMAHLPKSKTSMEKVVSLKQPRDSFAALKASLHERLKKEFLLPMPTLLFWAMNDPQAPAMENGIAFYSILAEKHPNVRLVIINKAGHFSFREKPEEFNSHIIAFTDYWNQVPAASSAKNP